jgi:hypothetical protein
VARQISFTPEVADYIAATRAGWWRSVRQRRFFVRITLISLVVALAGFAYGWVDGTPSEALITAGLAPVVVLLWLFVVCGLTWLLIPRRAGRLFRQQKSLNQEHLVSWDEQGLSFRAAKGYSELAWSDYHDWLERPAVFLFLLNDRLHHFVPQRALTAEQTDDLRTTADTHVAHQRRLQHS